MYTKSWRINLEKFCFLSRQDRLLSTNGLCILAVCVRLLNSHCIYEATSGEQSIWFVVGGTRWYVSVIETDFISCCTRLLWGHILLYLDILDILINDEKISTSVWIYLMALNCTFKHGENNKFMYIFATPAPQILWNSLPINRSLEFEIPQLISLSQPYRCRSCLCNDVTF